ncbi:MAG: sodium-dependent transporter [Planctomycetota bacterium]|nr:sodium-dependent transporter [Planctomycetota bacterium]
MSPTDYAPAEGRERWGSRIGLVLAMAGNAVGLGNFLRFPNQAVNNGGGSFMVAYFISLLLLGIPLMWMEWSIGRRGGSFGHSTVPGMFQSLTKARFVRYLGAVGIVMPLLIVIYYVYIESWTLGYAVQSITGELGNATSSPGGSQGFFADYLGTGGGFLGVESFQGSTIAVTFFAITILVNLWVLSRGLTKGIEVIAKIGMPLLVLCAVALVVRVLTLPDVDGRTVTDGLGIYWVPDVTRLFNFQEGAGAIWLAAAGQIFFTLSVGSGAINTYASYLSEDDDIALTGLTTVSANEFCEVVLGGTLAIPAAFLFFGADGVLEASSGNMGLAFITMPEVFAHTPLLGGEAGPMSVVVFGGLWFGLLFVAGITSSLALSQPTMAFMQDSMGLKRKTAAMVVGLIILVCVIPVILKPGVLDEIDYWAGTFGLVLFSTIEVILFMWIFGQKRAWKEMHKGADIQIPKVFRFIMTWITPFALVGMLVAWGWNEAWPILTFDSSPTGSPYTDMTQAGAWLGRVIMITLVALFVSLVAVASRRGHYDNITCEENT